MPRRKSIPPFSFDPNSLNAQFATLHGAIKAHADAVSARFDHLDRKVDSIETQAIKTNGRVNVLELWRATSRAKMAGIAAAFGFLGSMIAWVSGVLGGKP